MGAYSGVLVFHLAVTSIREVSMAPHLPRLPGLEPGPSPCDEQVGPGSGPGQRSDCGAALIHIVVTLAEAKRNAGIP
jgi:hypothetical protein